MSSKSCIDCGSLVWVGFFMFHHIVTVHPATSKECSLFSVFCRVMFLDVFHHTSHLFPFGGGAVFEFRGDFPQVTSYVLDRLKEWDPRERKYIGVGYFPHVV